MQELVLLVQVAFPSQMSVVHPGILSLIWTEMSFICSLGWFGARSDIFKSVALSFRPGIIWFGLVTCSSVLPMVEILAVLPTS